MKIHVPRHGMATILIAGALIALLDIAVIGRDIPAIRELDFAPQLADHLMFGAVVGVIVNWRSRDRSQP